MRRTVDQIYTEAVTTSQSWLNVPVRYFRLLKLHRALVSSQLKYGKMVGVQCTQIQSRRAAKCRLYLFAQISRFFSSVVSSYFTVKNDLPATRANKCATCGRVFPSCPFARATSCIYDTCRDHKMEYLNQGKTSRENFGSKNEGLNLSTHFVP